MAKATFTKQGFVTRVVFFETEYLTKAKMFAEMQALNGETVRTEIV